MLNGHFVSRSSDYIIYSVEAEAIDRVVAEFGPCLCSCRQIPMPLMIDSNQDGRNCRRPNLLQSPRNCSLRSPSPSRRTNRLLPFPARPRRRPKRPTPRPDPTPRNRRFILSRPEHPLMFRKQTRHHKLAGTRYHNG